MTSVIFATEYYPPFAPGGADWSHAAWAAALARRGRRVVVVTPNYGAAPREELDGVSVVRVAFPLKLRPGQGEAGWLIHRNPLFYLYFAWQIRRIARRENAALIHAQNKGAWIPAWLAGRVLRLPVVASVRDMAPVCPLGLCSLFEPWTTFDCSTRQYLTRCVPFFFKNYLPGAGPLRRARAWLSLLIAWLDERLRQAALRRVDGLIAVSRGNLATYPERLVGGGRASVVYNPRPSTSAPTEEEARRTRERLGIGPGPLVLYAGKLSLGKGTPVFLEALDTIRAAVPGVRFALAGKGELTVPSLPDVHRLGSIRQEDLFALYRAADVVVVPSVWPEPFSRVVLEAMHFGRAVVATAVGGTPEAVEHGLTGLLVPRQNPEALAKAVVELLLDPERRRRMGEAAARRVAEDFAEERLVPALLEAYDQAARRGRSRLSYYLGVSYRRKRVDADLERTAGYFKGQVLDVGGGRRRGAFSPPADCRWVIADVNRSHGPHVAADILALPFRDGAFEAVKATEVLEHVPDVARALSECRRVLRPGGHVVITVPFLERLHGDPDDYARYTGAMWERLLIQAGLRPLTIEPQDGYFTHLAGLLRFLVLRAPRMLRWAGYCAFPLLDLLARLDRTAVGRRPEFASFVGGYLIIAAR